mgnify:CR=1 FL=1
MKYYFQRTVAYQDVDMNRKLRIYTLENYILGIAGEVADQLGFGIKQLYPRQLTWILTHLNVEMSYMPTHEEQLEFETWIESDAHMLSVRDFRIYLLGENNSKCLIGKVKSVWAVLNLQTRAIVSIFNEPIFEGAVDGEVLELDRAPKLLPIERLKTTLPEATVGEQPHTIQYSDMDYNGHCNSCKYLEMMVNSYLPDYVQAPFRLDINYQKEIGLGEQVQVRYLVTDQFTQYQILDSTAQTNSSARITKL